MLDMPQALGKANAINASKCDRALSMTQRAHHVCNIEWLGRPGRWWATCRIQAVPGTSIGTLNQWWALCCASEGCRGQGLLLLFPSEGEGQGVHGRPPPRVWRRALDPPFLPPVFPRIPWVAEAERPVARAQQWLRWRLGRRQLCDLLRRSSAPAKAAPVGHVPRLDSGGAGVAPSHSRRADSASSRSHSHLGCAAAEGETFAQPRVMGKGSL